MNTEVTPEENRGKPVFRNLARWAWLSLVISTLTNLFFSGVFEKLDPELGRKLVALAGGTCAVTGVLAGIVALGGVPRHGRAGLLWPALTGICLWVGMAGGAFWVSSQVHRRAARQEQEIVLAPTVHAPGAPRVENANVGYGFDLPDGYNEIPRSALPAMYEKGFVRRVVNEPNRMLLVSLLAGGLPRQQLKASDVATLPGTTLTTFRWRGLEVGAFRVQEDKDGVHYVTFNVQIPLRQRGVQLSVAGSVAAETKLRAVVERVLASFDGETNW